MLEQYKNEQSIAYTIVTKMLLKDKLSHAYLIEANGYTKKNEFAYSFAKAILCPKHHINNQDENDCIICSKNKENQLDIKIIKPDGLMIKKSQMEELQKEFSKKSIESNYKIYIIEDADKLNKSSANSILKFLEEPEDGIIAILIVDNRYQLLDTIVSRCQIINLKNDKVDNIDLFEEKIKYFFKFDVELDMIEFVLNFAQELEKKKLDMFLYSYELWYSRVENKEQTLCSLNILERIYVDVLNYIVGNNLELFNNYEKEIGYISNQNNQKSICQKIELIISTKENIENNANINLSMDLLIKNFSEVNNNGSS